MRVAILGLKDDAFAAEVRRADVAGRTVGKAPRAADLVLVRMERLSGPGAPARAARGGRAGRRRLGVLAEGRARSFREGRRARGRTVRRASST
jgi:hypothetical protein